MRLVISLATRGRAERIIETVKRDCACLSRPDTTLMVQVDDDDEPTIRTLQAATLDKRVMVSIAPREDTIAAKWNRALIQPADIYSIIGDDDPYMIPDTDERIVRAAEVFPDGLGFVYGHLANASFSSIVCLTKKMTDLLGYIMPTHFPYWFCDHWVDDIARITDRVSFADVRSDQSRVGQTQEMREPAWWATWFDANYLRRRAEAAKIIDAIDEPDWRKQILRMHHPLIEYRSKWINDHVRQNARNLENWAALANRDERYMRVKQNAIAAVPEILKVLPPEEARVYGEILTPPPFIMNMLPQFNPAQLRAA